MHHALLEMLLFWLRFFLSGRRSKLFNRLSASDYV